MRTFLFRRPVFGAIAVLALLLSGSLPVFAQPVEQRADAVDPAVSIHSLASPDLSGDRASVTYFQPFEGRDPQLIIGPDARIQIDDTTQDPYKKIVHLIAIDEVTGMGQRCTGTFIGLRVVLTAAHCLWSPNFDGYPDTLEVIPARNGEERPFGSEFANNVWVPQGWIDSLTDGDLIPNWDYDYALVLMDDDSLGATVGTMTIGVLDGDALAAPDLNPTTAGYPGDKPIGTMWMGTDSSLTGLTENHLFHVIDSVGGQSGSAVWRGADQLIVGVEALETDTDNVSRRITQSVVDDFTAVCELVGCAFNVDTGGDVPPPVDDSAFQGIWQRTDLPVADGQATRTWMWGPGPNTSVMLETYDEAPGGERAVIYYDKSRMEITDPNADPNSIWYVTNGLLATELITGRMQLGNDRFENRSPANVNVAGDANDPNGPTYATFNSLLDLNPQPVGTILTQRVNRSGIVVDEVALAGQGVTVGYVDAVTNHSIAEPFWAFMNSSGVVYENGGFTTAPLFENAFFATGRPIAEPYWTDVLVGGTSKLVLVQCFERRCLTYTPDNAPEWRVEMGNIGQHYYAWRYEADTGSEPVPPVEAPVDVCLDDSESEFLTLLNTYRESNALPAFANSGVLNQVAYGHSLDMGEREYFDHFTPEGLAPQDRADAAGYPGLVAENLAAGSGVPVEILETWQDNPDTDEILLSETVVVGIGRVFVGDSPWEWYWTVQFGDTAAVAPTGCG